MERTEMKCRVRDCKTGSVETERQDRTPERTGNRIRAALRAICLLAGVAGVISGCAGAGAAESAGVQADEELVVYCPHPPGLIDPIVSEFENRTGIHVQVCTGGTGELLRQVAQGQEPGCDIFWGGSLTTVRSRQELFEPYISVNEPVVQAEFKNVEGSLTRFTDMPSVLMVNTNLLGDIVVEGYEDLLNPELKGEIAMCSPSSSSSAWEHLINMLYAMGNGDPEAGWDYVEDFVGNLDGKLLDSSSEVYRGVAEGRFTVGLTFEEGAAHYVADGEPVRIVYMEEGVISRPDVVCIAREARHRKEAETFVDFVTGRDAQTVIAAELDRRPVRSDVEEPEYLPDKSRIHIIHDDMEVTGQKKAVWLERFQTLYEEAKP